MCPVLRQEEAERGQGSRGRLRLRVGKSLVLDRSRDQGQSQKDVEKSVVGNRYILKRSGSPACAIRNDAKKVRKAHM